MVKKIKVKATKESAPAETEAQKYRRMAREATNPLKVIEYTFWAETKEGKNPPVPKHMMG